MIAGRLMGVAAGATLSGCCTFALPITGKVTRDGEVFVFGPSARTVERLCDGTLERVPIEPFLDRSLSPEGTIDFDAGGPFSGVAAGTCSRAYRCRATERVTS